MRYRTGLVARVLLGAVVKTRAPEFVIVGPRVHPAE